LEIIIKDLQRDIDYSFRSKGVWRLSKVKDRDYSVYDQAKLVERFIADMGIDRVTLIGRSFGGGVCC